MRWPSAITRGNSRRQVDAHGVPGAGGDAQERLPHHMRGLINDILDAGRIQTGTLSIARGAVRWPGWWIRPAPLTSIIGSTTTLLRPSPRLDPAEMHEFFRIIDEQARSSWLTLARNWVRSRSSSSPRGWTRPRCTSSSGSSTSRPAARG